MTRRRNQGEAGLINTWVQTVGIALATLWGIYTFVYKEWYLPRLAPVNISMDLELDKVSATQAEQGSGAAELVAIEMEVTATNPSTREVILLPNAWIAHGWQSTPWSGEDFAERAGVTFLQKERLGAQRFVTPRPGTAVATGKLFEDTKLKPSERIVRKIVFHVPRDRFDVVEVWTSLPTATKQGKLEVGWKYKDNSLSSTVYTQTSSGVRGEELPKDKDGGYGEGGAELQFFASRAAISLWK